MAGTISHEQFVTAFYTTFVFKVERKILEWALARPSTDAQAKQLAAGALDKFAVWHVEQRGPEQLLMCDLNSRTRSWLMVAPTTWDNGTGTRLYFGSAVVAMKNRRTGKAEMGLVFRLLLGFHRIYSRVLLRSALHNLRPRGRNRA
ncbi:MAG: hypothetical protein ABI790_10455 [Betaproteobacteria bacterium]